MANKSFSVAMSVYHKDNPESFERALQSITELQTVKPDEIVLVCDGPLNDSLDTVIEKYQSRFPIFNVVRLTENKGLGNALKLAVNAATNELIARMDSDDVAETSRFEQQLDFFEKHPEIDVVGGDITEFIDDEKNIVGKRVVPLNDDDIKRFMKKRCALNHVAVMYKKSAVQNAGGYQDWFWNEDYYLWIRMLLKGAVFANTGTVLVNVRVGKDMYKRRGGWKYFKSEISIQMLMLKYGVIGYVTFVSNCIKRLIVQILLPNCIRGWVFRKFARN